MVQKFAFTDLAIKKLAAEKTTYFWDATTRGLALRVTPKGARTFIVLVGSGKRSTIGRYPTVSLAVARAEANRRLAELTLGNYAPQAIAYDDAKTLFLTACASKNRPRTVADYRYHLDRHFRFGRRRLSDISPIEMARIMEKLAHTPGEQHHAYVAGRVFFRWAQRRRYTQHNPLDGIQLRKRPPRQRVLTNDELKSVWIAAIGDYGTRVRLLILTGQRVAQFLHFDPSWVEESERLIHFPASIMKGNRDHTIPYGDMTAQLLPRLVPGAYQSKRKRELDQLSGVSDWVLHDLRRVLASQWAALGIALPTIETYLAHRSGSFAGIVGIYQKHTWIPEMRHAVTLWENRLQEIVRPV